MAKTLKGLLALDEISKKTLGDYVKKAKTDVGIRMYASGNIMGEKRFKRASDDPTFQRNMSISKRRAWGIDRAVDRLTKEDIEDLAEMLTVEDVAYLVETAIEQLDELSHKTLHRYIKTLDWLPAEEKPRRSWERGTLYRYPKDYKPKDDNDRQAVNHTRGEKLAWRKLNPRSRVKVHASGDKVDAPKSQPKSDDFLKRVKPHRLTVLKRHGAEYGVKVHDDGRITDDPELKRRTIAKLHKRYYDAQKQVKKEDLEDLAAMLTVEDVAYLVELYGKGSLGKLRKYHQAAARAYGPDRAMHDDDTWEGREHDFYAARARHLIRARDTKDPKKRAEALKRARDLRGAGGSIEDVDAPLHVQHKIAGLKRKYFSKK